MGGSDHGHAFVERARQAVHQIGRQVGPTHEDIVDGHRSHRGVLAWIRRGGNHDGLEKRIPGLHEAGLRLVQLDEMETVAARSVRHGTKWIAAVKMSGVNLATLELARRVIHWHDNRLWMPVRGSRVSNDR